MAQTLTTVEELVEENQHLLSELETAYRNMEAILEQSTKEKDIAYQELQQKFNAMETLYAELSNKENMMIHMEKLSSIGQFISEIIHELANPLSAIAAHAHLALMMDPSDEIREEIAEIPKHVKRMTNQMNRFREMARKGQEDFRVFDLNESLADCLTTIEIVRPSGIEITTSLCDGALMIKGDPDQTTQIFLNLAKNAFDAMKDHGNSLHVSTKQVDADWIRNSGEVGCSCCQNEKAWLQILNIRPEYALVEFADNGSGIPPDILLSIFQPFFTTKERSKGTGLGLSISKDIVIRHRGNLAVKSVLGVGTIFQVLLPIAGNIKPDAKIARADDPET